MAINKESIVDVDLNADGIHKGSLIHTIGRLDDDADLFGVRVFRDGVEEDLTGISCNGYFRDSKGNRETINGTVSGNVASVTLTEDCYTYEGHFRLSIKLTGGGVTSTVRIVDGFIANTFA